MNGDYDDAVHLATAYANEQPDRALVQDTAWDGTDRAITPLPVAALSADQTHAAMTSKRGRRPTAGA